jgi:hypothetical protein
MVDPASSVNLDPLGPSVDLSSLDISRSVDFEKIDLTGTNLNTLVLDAQRSPTRPAPTEIPLPTTLLVKGDAEDAVSLLREPGAKAHGFSTHLVRSEVSSAIRAPRRRFCCRATLPSSIVSSHPSAYARVRTIHRRER